MFRHYLHLKKIPVVKFSQQQYICQYTVSKNDIDVAHYNFNAHQPILVILAEMSLRQYAIKRWFVIPHIS